MGGRIEDIWAKYWYYNIHKSVGFKKYKAKKDENLKPIRIMYASLFYQIIFKNTMFKKIILFLLLNFGALAIGSYFTDSGASSDWYH